MIAAVTPAGCGESERTDTATPAEWSYTGADGPSHWGSLDSEYAPCSEGRAQSPIDLAGSVRGRPPELVIDYRSGAAELDNNGHSVEASFDEAGSIELDGRPYEFAQFHFHAPCEHTLDGEHQAAELHFVNEAEDGSLAVIGVLVAEGPENRAFGRFLDAAPAAAGETAEAELEPGALLPRGSSGERWAYDGSLTTPPCSEGVAWTVLVRPIEVSVQQVARLTELYSDTARPVQPLGDRELVRGR
ncbi:MAG: carbonic anhydrase [Solirubrobacterales bacterium]